MGWVNRRVLRSGRSNALATATKFLTGGYHNHVYFWEAIELFRRLAVSGFVLLIPYDQIYWRIIMALAVSIPILVLTAFIKPLKRSEDNMLSIISQCILIFAYIICLLIRIVNNEYLSEEEKDNLVGYHTS